MLRKALLISTAVAAACLALAPRVHAAQEVADAGVTPAATLLLPYFEAQVPAFANQPPSGVTTRLEVTNLDPNARLLRVVVWSDLAVPVYGFNLSLQGYDSETIDVQQVLLGNVPQTSGPDARNCAGLLPPPQPSFAQQAELRALLTGKPSPQTGLCAGLEWDDDTIARGYVTVDVVNLCSSSASDPSKNGYFSSGGTAVASNLNRITGQAMMIDRKKKMWFATPVVHVEARSDLQPGARTFYGRYVGGDARDGREPLGSRYAVEYFDGPEDRSAPRTSAVFVWRDTQSRAAAPFPCGSVPRWYPLEAADVVAFDDDANAADVDSVLFPFPAATGRVRIGSNDLPVPFDQGWLFLNLTSTSEADDRSQAFVTVVHRPRGPSRTAAPGTVLP